MILLCGCSTSPAMTQPGIEAAHPYYSEHLGMVILGFQID